MIRIRNLRFAYPAGFALEVPRFDLSPGERVAVIGPSGSGKTTLLALIAGIAQPDAGDIAVGGVAVQAMGDRARLEWRRTRLGQVFQDFQLIEYLGVLDNILHPCRLGPGLPLTPARRDRARHLARAAGLGARLDHKPAALSQGERQRVAVCRALLTEPELVLADEPTGNLDPAAKTLVLDMILDRGAPHAVLAVTHDHALLDRFDRMVDFAEFRAGVA